MISGKPNLDPTSKRGKYDQILLNEHIPEGEQEVLFEGKELDSEEMRQEIWKDFENRQEQMKILRRDFAPTQLDLEDSYNPINQVWYNRGATGMENNPRMKEMFVDLEYWIEDVIGLPQIQKKQMKMYKGTTKKWQILDDEAHSRDQIEKLQASVNAPSPAQLEQWQEKHDVPLNLPATNATVSKWRDEPLAVESADFDPKAIQEKRKFNRDQFIERFEVPKQLSEGSH